MKLPLKRLKEGLNRGVFREYRQMGLTGYALLMTLLTNGHKDLKGRQVAYRAVKNRFMARLRASCAKEIESFLSAEKSASPLARERSNRVWVCWLQGMDKAPELVKRCYESLQRCLPEDRELTLITEENLRDYVTLPDFILQKYQSGALCMAHMSDLIRINLLIEHGGTWIDSTVFLSDSDIPWAMLDNELFFFQFSDPKNFYKINKGFDDRCLAASNWFLTAAQNNDVLRLTRHLLYSQLKKGDAQDYFIFHYMLQLALETYPQAWNAAPFYCAKSAFTLQERLFDKWDEGEWAMMKRAAPIHKLSHKPFAGRTPEVGTYADKLLRGELS